jgi:hypothetical protein
LVQAKANPKNVVKQSSTGRGYLDLECVCCDFSVFFGVTFKVAPRAMEYWCFELSFCTLEPWKLGHNGFHILFGKMEKRLFGLFNNSIMELAWGHETLDSQHGVAIQAGVITSILLNPRKCGWRKKLFLMRMGQAARLVWEEVVAKERTSISA